MTCVVSFSFAARYAVLDDGRVVPITGFYDRDEELTDDPREACSFVCGEGDLWFAEKVSAYSRAAIN